jgi:hypothetical protein
VIGERSTQDAEEGDDHRPVLHESQREASIWNLRLNKLRDFALLVKTVLFISLSCHELATCRPFNKRQSRVTSTVRRAGSMRARAHKLRASYGLAGCYVERALAWQRGKTTIVGSKRPRSASEQERASYTKAKAHLRLGGGEGLRQSRE